MSEYTKRANAADTARDEAFDMGGKWSRAEYLALAQVHATLAVAAAGWAQAGMFPDADDLTSAEAEDEFLSRATRFIAANPPLRIPSDGMHIGREVCVRCDGPILVTQPIEYVVDHCAAHVGCLPSAFTGSERADEVGA